MKTVHNCWCSGIFMTNFKAIWYFLRLTIGVHYLTTMSDISQIVSTSLILLVATFFLFAAVAFLLFATSPSFLSLFSGSMFSWSKHHCPHGDVESVLRDKSLNVKWVGISYRRRERSVYSTFYTPRLWRVGCNS